MKRFLLVLSLVLGMLTAARADWRLIGPAAGNIEELTPDRSNPGLWFAVNDATLYRSTDGGRTWKSTGLRNVGHQGYYPVTGNSVTVIPATSEVLVLKEGGKAVTEIWRSQDHGKSFQYFSTTPFTLTRIVPHHSRPEILYGAALYEWGIVVSKDGGRHWSAFTNLPLPMEQHPGCSAPGIDESYIAVSPFDPGTVFVSGVLSFSCGPESDGESFFMQSTNSGKSWSPVNEGGGLFHTDPVFPDRLFSFDSYNLLLLTKSGWQKLPALEGLRDLVSVPRHANELLAFVSYPNQKIVRSTDSGHSWHDSSVGIHGRIKNLAALDDPFRGMLGGTSGAGLYFRDENHEWTAVNGGFREAVINDVQGSETMLYSLTHGGFLYTTQNGVSWQLPFGLRGQGVYSMAVDPADPHHAVVLSSGIQVTRNGGLNWTQAKLDKGTISSVAAIDPTNPRTVYVAKDTSYGLLKSTDGGNSFRALFPHFSSKGYQDISRIVVDPNDGRIVFFVAPYFGIFKSADSGVSVKPVVNGISPPCPQCNSNPAIDLAPLAARHAYLCITMQGKIYRTNDAAEHWQLVGQGPVRQWVNRLFLADGMGQHLYVLAGYAQHLYESPDGGTTWSDLTNRFGPQTEVYALTDPRRLPLYAATNHGTFVLQ